jgi:hypothetical protein
MQLIKTAKTLALCTMLSLAAISAPAFAADGDAMQSFQREVSTMANKDGMVSKKDFIAMMEKKFARWTRPRKACYRQPTS